MTLTYDYFQRHSPTSSKERAKLPGSSRKAADSLETGLADPRMMVWPAEFRAHPFTPPFHFEVCEMLPGTTGWTL